MNVRELIQILERADPNALVVLNDRTEDMRTGLIREFTVDDIRKIVLGTMHDYDAEFVCVWTDCNGDAHGPISGVLIGPI